MKRSLSSWFLLRALLSGLLLSCSAGLNAQTKARLPAYEVFAGASMLGLRPGGELSRVWLPGWQVAATRYFTGRLGATMDVSGFYGEREVATVGGGTRAVDFRQIALLGGPQIRLIRRERVQTNFRALFGFANGAAQGQSGAGVPPAVTVGGSALAATFGSAVDIRLREKWALRVQPGVFLTRYGGELERNFRVSVGLVYSGGR